MAALLHPGVYVQEVPGGARSIEGVPTSTAIFVGETERGSFEPTKIRGIAEYDRLFGGYARHAGTARMKLTMRFAIDLFFQNGGTAAYVLRTNTGTTSAPNTVVATRDLDFPGTPDPVTFTDMIRAASPGEWGTNVYAVIQNRPLNRFRIAVFYRAPGEANARFVEDWDNLTLQLAGPNYVGDVLKRSSFVRWQPEDTTDDMPDRSSRPVNDVDDDVNVLELDKQDPSPFATGESLAGTVLDDTTVPSDSNAEADAATLQPMLATLNGIDDAALLVGASARWLNGTGDDGFADDDAVGTYYDVLRTYTDSRPKQDLFFVADIIANGTLNGDVIPFFNGLTKSNFAAVYWPHVSVADPFATTPLVVPPSGAVAGIFARTDGRRGVFKAPAGVEATVGGIVGLERSLIDGEQDDMNPIGLNAIRQMPGAGTVVWGSRTLMPTSEWRYVPVRRLAMFLRKSIFNGIQFAVFEPNDTNLWSTLRTTITAFMNTQFRNGAFAGSSARDAYFVKVDSDTTPPEDQAAGIVNILVGFAPLRPAEFVVVRLSQKTASSG